MVAEQRTMRIGVNCYQLLPSIGGLKQYFFSLFDELLERNDGNRYVFFYFPHNLKELENLKSTAWQRDAVLLKDQVEAGQHLERLDLYFCPFGSLWPRPLPIPTVTTLVDIQEVFYPEYFSETDLFNRQYHYVGSTRMSDRVITISAFSKETIVEHHRISPEKIQVVHLCADNRFHRAGEIARRPDFSLPAKDFIIYPANRWHHKNHDVLLQALKWLKENRGLKIDVVFTGHDIPGGYPLLQRASEYGLEDGVFSAGYVSVEELAYLYRRARMLVFPSRFEGFGIPLVEAMAAGCPAAASRVTSLPEIGLDAVTYFDPASPEDMALTIERLWRDDALREALVKKGFRRAKAFSSVNVAEAHVKVFREAADHYSKTRYAWNYLVYQHYHKMMTGLRHRRHVMEKMKNKG